MTSWYTPVTYTSTIYLLTLLKAALTKSSSDSSSSGHPALLQLIWLHSVIAALKSNNYIHMVCRYKCINVFQISPIHSFESLYEILK